MLLTTISSSCNNFILRSKRELVDTIGNIATGIALKDILDCECYKELGIVF